MEDSFSCLCTSVGNDGFSAVLSALKAFYGRRITVVGCDARPDAYGLYLADRGFQVPYRNDPDHRKRLLQIAKKEECSVLLPLSTEDQEYFAMHRAYFERENLRVVVNELETVRTANNKLQLYDFCREARLPIAAYISVRDRISFEEGLKNLGYPQKRVVFKLAQGTGARGLVVLDPEAIVFDVMASQWVHRRVPANELISSFDRSGWHDGVLCEYLPGEEYSVDVLSSHGETLASVVRNRFSSFLGLALHAEVIKDDGIADLARQLVELLGFSYVSNVQFRKDADGLPRIMEVNPRIPGTIGLTVQSGINMPSLAVELALGNEVTDRFHVRYGLRILRHWGGVYHDGPLLTDRNGI